MYIPKAFEVSEQEEIFSFLENNAFGQLTSVMDGKPFSTHMPFLVSEDKQKLLAHIAKQNPQHLEISGQTVLASFQGPHDYISPAWYHDPGVPTWNYQALHIYGKCSVIKDPDRIKEIIEVLTEKYESRFEKPWRPQYKDELTQAIVGLELQITDIQCKYKLSQNRSIKDRQQVIAELEQAGSFDLANAMKNQRN